MDSQSIVKICWTLKPMLYKWRKIIENSQCCRKMQISISCESGEDYNYIENVVKCSNSNKEKAESVSTVEEEKT